MGLIYKFCRKVLITDIADTRSRTSADQTQNYADFLSAWVYVKSALVRDASEASMFNVEQKRIQKLRLGWFEHTQEKTHNVAKTCRYYGITRQTYYKWLKRYGLHGKSGLVNQSKRPLTPPPPSALDSKTRRIIKKLRLDYCWGSSRIKRWLKMRYNINIGSSTVYKVLKQYKIDSPSLLKKNWKR
mgnify:CR=1 FL=1